MVMVAAPLSPNPIVQIHERFKEVEAGFKTWLAKQPIQVEAVVVTATSAFQGAAIGGLLGTLSPDAGSMPTLPDTLNSQAMTSLKQAQA